MESNAVPIPELTEEKEKENQTQATATVGETVVEKPKVKRIGKLRKELEDVKKERDDFKEKNLRKAAEFENYRRRVERDFFNHVQDATANLIFELLPVLDDLERSLKSAEGNSDFATLHQAVVMIHEKFQKVLENRGLKPIEAVGKPFDPEKHDALLMVESDGKPSQAVIEEHLKGYELNDRVIRHSQVIVSK